MTPRIAQSVSEIIAPLRPAAAGLLAGALSFALPSCGRRSRARTSSSSTGPSRRRSTRR
ncbi:MAG: hypothetical protein R3F11_23465 [Verrucomicrobiales bacterium]